jgi:hypothetical protein
VSRATLESLRQITALPDALRVHACECGHPEMRRLPYGTPLPILWLGGTADRCSGDPYETRAARRIVVGELDGRSFRG